MIFWVRQVTWDKLQQAYRQMEKVRLARKELSEFSFFLRPLWEFIFSHPAFINIARDEMRSILSATINTDARKALALYKGDPMITNNTEVTPAEPLLQFFEYSHLPLHLQPTSREFHCMAHGLVENLPRNPERTEALRKLLEAKDCAVRAAIFKVQ